LENQGNFDGGANSYPERHSKALTMQTYKFLSGSSKGYEIDFLFLHSITWEQEIDCLFSQKFLNQKMSVLVCFTALPACWAFLFQIFKRW